MLTALMLTALISQCALMVAPSTMSAIVRVESGGNPYAIGVVGGRLLRQPRNEAEAISTVQVLEKTGWDYSVGLTQVNRKNFERHGLTIKNMFEPCANLRAGGAILQECYRRYDGENKAVRLSKAFSCYYTGSYTGVGREYAWRVFEAARGN